MSIGKIHEFDIESGQWNTYCERLEMYFVANKVAAEIQLATLISVVGDRCYELMVNLTSPKKPSELTYRELVLLVEKHLNPKPSIMAERYRFRLRRQHTNESIAQYVAELKKLARWCEFKEGLMENLRDQLVCGVRGDTIRQRLFAEGNVTFTKAVELASAWEAAEKDAAAVDRGAGSAGGSCGASTTQSGRAAGTSGDGAEGVNLMTAAAQARQRGAGGAGADGGGWTRPIQHSTGTVDRIDRPCFACGAINHQVSRCRFKNYICSACKDKGHLRRVCPKWQNKSKALNGMASSGNQRHKMNNYFVAEDDDDASEPEDEAIYRMELSGYKPVSLLLSVNGKPLSMEIDTGAASSFINRETYNKLFKDQVLQVSKTVFKFYDGTRIKPLGVITPLVQYYDRSKHLDLFVLDRGETSLIGRQWLAELAIEIPMFKGSNNNYSVINNVSSDCHELSLILDRYKEVLNGGLGCFSGGTATLHVREGATPVFRRARPLPFALRERVDAEIDAMLRDGIIEPVDCAEWATPLVPVNKKDGSLRICADFKVTLNPVLIVDRYPLPRVEELFATLAGGQQFSKIDLSQAYNQICLAEESKMLTVINTHRGLFKYNRLVFGLSSSPGIFSRMITAIISDIPNAQAFLDDILITGKDRKSHLATLEKVLCTLKKFGLKIKSSKCEFLADEVSYLGYVISKDGIKPDPNKLTAISKMPQPNNVTELRSFLGMINFYAKFIRGISNILQPFYRLLKRGCRWEWTRECNLAFDQIKSLLLSSQVLAHYDPNKKLTLICDASSHGVGGVLNQPDEQGRERPVAYVSRKLNTAEHNYSQIHREALAIIYCVRKFHQYLYGRRFLLKTDHKPLVSIFGPHTGVPDMTSSRMQRWALILTGYDFDIQYVNTTANCADALSRLPSGEQRKFETPEQCYLHFASDALLIDNQEIKNMTARDPLLGRVINYINEGWPEFIEVKGLQPYFNRRKELYSELGCVMWGRRVVIPEACRELILRELHEPHMGIVKTKAMARSYVWWPGIDEAIENCCSACDVCAAVSSSPPASTPIPWHWPSRPYERVHLDFLGPIEGRTYLVAIDARSKWIEVFRMSHTSAGDTIVRLRESWSRWGIPKQIVTDNGPPFSSKEFNDFLNLNGVNHMYSPPYHPASNGAAEGAVKLIKNVIKKAIFKRVDIDASILKFLLYYHNTPHSTIGESPAMMLQGRELRTRLDILKPDQVNRVINKQYKSLEHSNKLNREFELGESIRYREYRGERKWSNGLVTKKNGRSDYTVVASDGTCHHRHSDQLKRRMRESFYTGPATATSSTVPEVSSEKTLVSSEVVLGDTGRKVSDVSANRQNQSSDSPGSPSPSIALSPASTSPKQRDNPELVSVTMDKGMEGTPVERQRRYPLRERKPVKKYGIEID